MRPADWPTVEEVEQALQRRGTPVSKQSIETVMDACWGQVLRRHGGSSPPEPTPVTCLQCGESLELYMAEGQASLEHLETGAHRIRLEPERRAVTIRVLPAEGR